MDTRDTILLTREPIDVNAVHDAVRDPACGAICCFVGTSRDVHEGRPVTSLEYEGYDEMATKELGRLAERIRKNHPAVVRIALVHRLGEVALAEASVAIAVSTPHRGESFEACRYGIDSLKAELPVWKKEHYDDGSQPRWVSNSETAPKVSS